MAVSKYEPSGDSGLLENDRRRTIYETVEAEPGLCLSAVSEESGVALSTVRYHVRVLEDENVIQSVTACGKRRYFPFSQDDVELRSVLFEPAKRRVLEALATLGPTHNARLATALECDSSTVSHHLSMLEDAGFVVRKRDGRTVVNELAPTVESVIFEDWSNHGSDESESRLEAEVA
ncbi:winged helix-turn-helix transcriptional regulator [Saliphagus sp. GCM10025334]